MDNTQRRLPLIPLSPLINTSSEYAKLLAETTKSLTNDDNTPSVKNNLQKNLIKEREKLDRLTKNMHNIQTSALSDFPINEVAKEIAYINCSLFRMVSLNEKWLCNFDKQSNIVPLLDFHRYLSHSFAHQIIINCEATKGLKKPTSIIGDLIQIAYILLNIYRDFSGCTAILSCLQMPEVQRLESMWNLCPMKLITAYKELVLMLSPRNDYEAYFRQLSLHMSQFLNTTPTKSQMILVPYMNAHLSTLRSLINTHVLSTTDVVLSSVGQEMLSSFVRVLEFCQQYSQMDPSEISEYRVSPKRQSKRNSGLRLSISLCLDLDQIRSSPNIYHWLVSRAYLNRHQLYTESLTVEPLHVGEIEIEPQEEYDLYWDFFTPKPPIKPVRSNKGIQETVVNNLEVSETTSPADTNEEQQRNIEQDVQSTPVNEADKKLSEAVKTPEEGTVATAVVNIPKKRNSSTQTMPILSPAAPEFIPTTMVKVEDDVVILDDDEEEEEWTGYPLGSQASNDDDEEWTGYPIQDDEEDEEEIWKGYPIPQEERTCPSSPSTPPQDEPMEEEYEWKISAIGKAAARRMQYSVSNTDTPRKRLPSPFAPSSST